MNEDEHDDEPRRNIAGLRPFKKNDPRINRSGKPRSFLEFRKLAQQIAAERVISASGDWVTRAEALLRKWEKSKNPQLQKAFIEYAFGPPPQKLETDALENKTHLVLYYAHEREAIERENNDREVLTLKPPGEGASHRLKGP
jgi:hypothetical protein